MGRLTNIFSLLNSKKTLSLVCLFLIILSGVLIHTLIVREKVGKEEDIYYLWLEGKRLLTGENPYARVLSGNLRVNNKYATYFPLFYILSYLSQFIGLKNYSEWLSFWQNIFLLFNLGIALSIFYTLYKNDLILLGFFSALFWLFNRWTLHVTQIAHIDFIPIFFLITSLVIFRKNKFISLLFLSISLSVKQIGIFLIPLYLIWIWQSEEKNKLKNTLIGFVVIFIFPVLTSLPFILWNAEGLLKSIIFSVTRNPDSHFNALSLDAYMGKKIPAFIGIKAKIPMLFLMILIYLSNLKRQIGMYTSSLFIMTVFIDFNSVLFLQYMCWVVPLIPLCVCDQINTNRQKT